MPVTAAPLAWASVSGAASVMPLPATMSPTACALMRGASTVMRLLPPPAVDKMTAVSASAPVPTVIVVPTTKPVRLTTGITVSPATVATRTVVAPAVPTAATTAGSRFAPVSI